MAESIIPLLRWEMADSVPSISTEDLRFIQTTSTLSTHLRVVVNLLRLTLT